MENNFEKIVRKYMSVNSPDIPEPDASFMEEAHRKINKRKKNSTFKSSLGLFNFIFSEINFYQTALTAMIILLVFLLLSPKNQNQSFTEQMINESRSASSSTVLAGLTRVNSNETSVNSSTVLSSIITFAAKN
jgi:uncharacterized membrane protein YgaE (UPF0421/DUF939 family)